MEIIIETYINNKVEELTRYKADICPAVNQVVVLQNEEDEDKLHYYSVTQVEHFITPHYCNASIYVVPIPEVIAGKYPQNFHGVDWGDSESYSVDAVVGVSTNTLKILSADLKPRTPNVDNPEDAYKLKKLIGMVERAEQLKRMGAEELIQEVLKTDAADCLEVEALMDRVLPGWELKDRDVQKRREPSLEQHSSTELVDFMAKACHYAQEHISYSENENETSVDREEYLQCVSYQMACFLAQNTVLGGCGVPWNIVIDNLTVDMGKSASQWEDILNEHAKGLGGWKQTGNE